MKILSFLADWVRVRLVSRMQDLRRCPRCGSELTTGFGLAGGGYGTYKFCDTTGCRFFVKRQSKE